jgi:hypothetical protein
MPKSSEVAMERYSRSSNYREDIPETNSEAYWFLVSVRDHLKYRQDNALLYSNAEQYGALTDARNVLVGCLCILNDEFAEAITAAIEVTA